ncbi:MAG: outer membrane protein transport protein [Candidatus Hydrothermae bacterium]|nr:outer membrane protein transport protein [Candidatus Hydrothermae bacterium]
MKPYRLWGLILLFMTASWLTAAGFSLSGVGTKGLSMGGAYRSVVSDWSSIFWNPAGLAAVEMNEISLTGTFISPLSSYVPHTQIPGYDGGYPMRYRVNAKSRLFVLPQIAYVMNADFLSSTKFGVALFTPFGLGASWDLYDPPIGFYERGYTPPKAFPEHDWESDISITCAYAGFARKFGPLSIGLSGGPLFGSISLRKVRLYDPVTVDTSLYSLPVQFRYFPIDTRFDGSGVSFGLNFGIKLEPLKNLTLGLSGRYYSPVKLTGDVNSAIYFPKNSVLESLADPEGKIFFQGGVLEADGDVSTELKLPMSLGGGISYAFGDLTLAFDAELTTWSVLDQIALDITGISFFGDSLPDDTLVMNWRNTWKYSFGIEYRGGERTVIRLGAYYDEGAVTDSTLTPLIPDINSKVSVNVGLSYLLTDRLTFDFNYEFVRASRKSVSNFVDVDSDGEPDNMPGEYSLSVDAAGIGLSFRF